MTQVQMADRLRLYAREPVPHELALALLDDAQYELIDKLYWGFLKSLITIETSKTLDATSGYYNLASLTTTIYMSDKGLLGVKPHGDNYPFCKEISFEEYRTIVDVTSLNPMVVFTLLDPKYYMIGTKLYFLPWAVGDTTTIDAYFVKRPQVFSVSAIAETCSLEAELHPLIVGLACGAFPKSGIAKAKRQQALENIDQLNMRHPQTESWKKDVMSYFDPAAGFGAGGYRLFPSLVTTDGVITIQGVTGGQAITFQG